MQHAAFSVVIPIYNEESNIPQLYRRLCDVVKKTAEMWEFIFVDDGSDDNSLSILKKYHNSDSRVRVISFSRNFGHQNAISAGLTFCQGNCAIIIDGDLQDPPEILPDFLKKWQEGYQVVYAIRKRRKEVLFKRILYKLFYRILWILARIDIPIDAGDFCLMDRKVVNLINSFPEKNRFVRGLRSWVGFKQAGIEYHRDERYSGKSKFSFSKLARLAADGIFSFSEFPLKIIILLGLIIAVGSIFYAIYLIIAHFLFPEIQIPGWTSIVVGITFLGGVQLIFIGIVIEYITRIYDEVKNRPMYIIAESVGISDDTQEDAKNAKEVVSYHSRIQC
jgi:glycosyltransferase involved in cell wall biosynthesis